MKGFGGKFECRGSQVCFLLLMRPAVSGFQAMRMCVAGFSTHKKNKPALKTFQIL
jgi:hypothetical protein